MLLVSPQLRNQSEIYELNLGNLKALESPSEIRIKRFKDYLSKSTALDQVNVREAKAVPKDYSGMVFDEVEGKSKAFIYSEGTVEKEIDLSNLKYQYQGEAKVGKITRADLPSENLITNNAQQKIALDSMIKDGLVDSKNATHVKDAKIMLKAMADIKSGQISNYSPPQRDHAAGALERIQKRIEKITGIKGGGVSSSLAKKDLSAHDDETAHKRSSIALIATAIGKVSHALSSGVKLISKAVRSKATDIKSKSTDSHSFKGKTDLSHEPTAVKGTKQRGFKDAILEIKDSIKEYFTKPASKLQRTENVKKPAPKLQRTGNVKKHKAQTKGPAR